MTALWPFQLTGQWSNGMEKIRQKAEARKIAQAAEQSKRNRDSSNSLFEKTIS